MVAIGRVVQVWCEESKQLGSGYRVNVRRMLTALHVLGDANECSVRFCREVDYRPAKVVWRGPSGVDVAVIEFVDEPSALTDRDPIWAGSRWVDGECRAAGYPAFLDFPDGPEVEGFVGELLSLSGTERGFLHAAGRWAENRTAEQWGGMSGAGLFSGRCLIGVVTHAMANRLIACPISTLFEDESFRKRFPEFRLDDTALWPVADQPAIRLLRPRAHRLNASLDRPPSELLLAHNEVVPFDDDLRGPELALLEDFTVDRGPAMLVFTGSGGAGKTRLMIEWCARVRERGWLAGFVEPGHRDVARVTEGETRRVLVVDYPEGRVREVVELCRGAQAAQASVRLVLLARSRGPWFDELRQDVEGDLVAHADWRELGKLDDTQRRRTYESARAAFAKGVPIEQTPQNLARDELPLFAHMRALLRAYGEREADERAEEVLARMLAHERKHWCSHLVRLLHRSDQVTVRKLERVLTALVLFGGFDGSLGELLRWLLPELERDERDIFAECIGDLYRRGDRVMSLQPDLLGEQLVCEVLSRAADVDGVSGVEQWLSLSLDEHAPAGSVGQTLLVLTRLVERGIDAARDWLHRFLQPRCAAWVQACAEIRNNADPRGHELAAAMRCLQDTNLARQVWDLLPNSTLELALLRVEVARLLLHHGSAFADSEPAIAERGRWENNLGEALSALGRREESLAVAENAVLTFRRLTSMYPNRSKHVNNLAATLTNLGNRLVEVGRLEDALKAAQESVETLRSLGNDCPPGWLILALNCLGNRLNQVRRREEAVEIGRECVDRCRKSAEEDPALFAPTLASALNNFGSHLADAGLLQEAMAANMESLSISRALAAANPDANLRKLASALTNTSSRSAALGHHNDALDQALEGVNIYRTLAQAEYEAFAPDLSAAIHNCGLRLDKAGRSSEAIKSLQEAIQIRLELARTTPALFLSQAAASYLELSLVQRDQALYVDAVRSASMAVRLVWVSQQYAPTDPQLLDDIYKNTRELCEVGGVDIPDELQVYFEVD